MREGSAPGEATGSRLAGIPAVEAGGASYAPQGLAEDISRLAAEPLLTGDFAARGLTKLLPAPKRTGVAGAD